MDEDHLSLQNARSGQGASRGSGEGSPEPLMDGHMKLDPRKIQNFFGGKAFSGVVNTGSSRVHMGDQIAGVINNNCPDNASKTRFKGQYSSMALRPVANYVARPALEAQLKERLHNTIEQREQSSKILVVYGLGGAGKSQLMLHYIENHKGDYSSIFWLDAGTKERLEKDFKQIHNLLLHPSRSDIEIDTCITEVKHWCDLEKGQLLFVIDSADNIDDRDSPMYIELRKFIVNSACADVVITTRSRSATNMTPFEPVCVAEMDIEESRKLFLRRSKLLGSAPGLLATVDEITTELGFFALAVNLAASHVAQTSRFRRDPSLYLLEYRKRRKLLLEQRPRDHADSYNDSILAAWETTYDAINRFDPQACKLLSLLAFLNPQDILCDFFETADETDGEASVNDFKSGSTDSLDESLAVLESYSLIESRDEPRSYSMHNLVHAWSYERLDRHERICACGASLGALVIFTRGCTEQSEFNSRLGSHIMSAFGKTRELDQPEGPAKSHILDSLQHLASFLFTHCQLFKSAASVLTFNHKSYQRLRTRNTPRWLEHLTLFGLLQSFQYLFNEAESLLQQALFGWWGNHKGIIPPVVQCASLLIHVLVKQGKSSQAEQLLAWLTQEMKSMQARPEALLACLEYLGSPQLVLRKYSDAEHTFRLRLQIEEQIFGVHNPKTWASLASLAENQAAQQKYSEALITLKGVVEAIDDDPDLVNLDALSCIHQLGNVLADQGNLKGAEICYRRILYEEKRKPETGPAFELSSTLRLARILHRRYYHGEALELSQQAFERCVESFGAQHPTTISVGDFVALVRSNLREAMAPLNGE